MKIGESNIIITGAASGFGKAMSLNFASQNAIVYALDINENALIELKNEGGGNIHTFRCDITKNDEVERVIEDIFKIDKKINVLINNAGIMKNAPLINLLNRPDTRHSVELWENVIQVNQNSVFYVTRSVVNNMIKNRNHGVIVNISSIAAQGNAGQTAYSASKAAVEAMSKVWAKELGGFGIRSVCIAPGFMDTNATHDVLEEKALEKWIQRTPLKRTGKIHEVVHAAKFVIENDFFSNETLKLNGGVSF